jgi:hypothetical protein
MMSRWTTERGPVPFPGSGARSAARARPLTIRGAHPLAAVAHAQVGQVSTVDEASALQAVAGYRPVQSPMSHCPYLRSGEELT